MDKDDLRDIIQLIANEDCEVSFNSLFKHYYPGLLHFATGILHDRRLAEETVDDVFVKIWGNRKMLSSIGNLTYYLYTATKHTAINYLEKKQKSRVVDIVDVENELDTVSYTPEDSTIQNENVQIIQNTINTLPHKCRLIFRLIKEEGLKYKEVADVTNLSVKTVEAHMTLAYTRMAESLEKIFPDYMRRNSFRKKVNNS